MAKITKHLKWIVPLLIGLALVLLTLIYLATRNVSGLTGVLLHIFSVVISSSISIFGGHLLSQWRFQRTGRAESAVQRLADLYRSLYWAARLIMELQDSDNEDYQEQRSQIMRIEGILMSQLPTASSAIKDWKEFAPEDVAKAMREFEPENRTEENNE